MKTRCCTLFLAVIVASSSVGAEGQALNENSLGEQLRRLEAEREPADKLRRATDMASRHLLSSLQVKAIAGRLPDDAARLDFATAAYPRVVDPENFYEVYDAFTTFSKVLRLHDRVQRFQRPRPDFPPPVVAPQTVHPDEMKDILNALKKESFDQTRMKVARQILSASQRQFLSTQVRDLLRCFDFEPSRLELAKFAYAYTFDRERYFLVNEAFDFPSTKESLARYIETWKPPVDR